MDYSRKRALYRELTSRFSIFMTAQLNNTSLTLLELEYGLGPAYADTNMHQAMYLSIS